jgi:hypothetical protein
MAASDMTHRFFLHPMMLYVHSTLILKFKDCLCNALRTLFSKGPPQDTGAGTLRLIVISLQRFLAVGEGVTQSLESTAPQEAIDGDTFSDDSGFCHYCDLMDYGRRYGDAKLRVGCCSGKYGGWYGKCRKVILFSLLSSRTFCKKSFV